MCATRRPIRIEVSNRELEAHLESYRQKALDLGARAAEVIPASLVSVDERVRLKCLMPRCFHVGTSPNCPPHTPEPEFMRQALSRYSWAVVYLIEVDNWHQNAGSAGKPKTSKTFHSTVFDITGALEGLAYRDGYYLALGFAGGTCKITLCHGLDCQALNGGVCRFPLRSRPSMEGVGIDVFGLAASLGWDVYPVCQKETEPKSVPRAVSIGIVFVH